MKQKNMKGNSSRGYGPDRSPGNGRGPNSVNNGKNPAPAPMRGGFDNAMMASPDRKKVMQMKQQEYNFRESGRGKGSI